MKNYFTQFTAVSDTNVRTEANLQHKRYGTETLYLLFGKFQILGRVGHNKSAVGENIIMEFHQEVRKKVSKVVDDRQTDMQTQNQMMCHDLDSRLIGLSTGRAKTIP